MLRHEAEKVCEVLEFLPSSSYKQRVGEGVFKQFLQHINAGDFPYGVALGFIMQSHCSVETHVQTVGCRTVTYVLPIGGLTTMAWQGNHIPQKTKHCASTNCKAMLYIADTVNETTSTCKV